MSESQEWIKIFKLSPEDLGKLHTQADPTLSLLHTVLLEKYIPEDQYLDWAANKYLLPQISANFSARDIDSEAFEKAAGLFHWRQDIFPVGLWGNTLYLLCHEPSTIEVPDYRIQYILAPATRMKEIWAEIKGSLQNQTATEAPAAQTQTQTSASQPEAQPMTAASSPEFEQTMTAAAATDGVQLSSVPSEEAPAGMAAPEGLSFGSVTEAAPEGIQLGSVPSEEQEDSSEAPSDESEGEESHEAPEGITLSSTAPSLSFASLTNPVAKMETPAEAPKVEESALIEPAISEPAPAAPRPAPQPAVSASAAPTPPQTQDDPPLLNLTKMLGDDQPQAAAPKTPKASPKISPALAALKVDPKKAAGLPPVPPSPFAGATQEPEAPAAASQHSNPQAEVAETAAPTENAAPVEAAAPEVAAPSPAPAVAAAPHFTKSEWSFTEVNKVTALKQEGQTVSRTIEFTHLTTSGGGDLEMCKAVSDEEVSKATDDPRKARHIGEVALNSFKTMKTYFPDAIFFVFLGSNLIPWRWTQNWSRSLDTPPGPIDLSTPSIFRIAFQTGLPYHGYVVPSPVNETFFKTWNNGVLPDHVTLMPIKIGNLIAGMIMGRADRASIDYKYSLKYMEGLALNISQALQDISVKSAS